MQLIQRMLIEVVVMIVTHKCCVDLGEISNITRNLPISLRPCKLNRRRPPRKNRVNDNIRIFSNRDDSSRMPNPSIRNLALVHSKNWSFDGK